MLIKFANASLCDQGELFHGELWVDDVSGLIVDPPTSGTSFQTIDLNGLVLAPGFLDVQVNGLYGFNFSELRLSHPSTVREYLTHYHDVMAKYLHTGVTSICPTVTSNFPEVYKNVLPIVGPSRSAYEVDSLGAHLEGPFINLCKKGCHPSETFVDAKSGNTKISQVYGGDENLEKNVCIITAAPEIPGVLDAIPSITAKNIIYSIGHTMADYETGLRAIHNGATMITHLYNAMPQPHHRDAGVVGLVNSPLADQIPYFGLIADGVHIDPAMVNMAIKSAPEKCMLVTDAMHLIGLQDGVYKWDDREIVKKGYSLKLKGTDTLAGSATTLDQCVRNVMKWANMPLEKAVECATNVPARAVGVQLRKGFLLRGCDADLVVLDVRGHVKRVYKLGKRVRDMLVGTRAQL